MSNTNSQSFMSLRNKVISYVYIIIACTIVTFAFHFYHAWQNKQRQFQILQIYESSICDSKQFLSVNRTKQMEEFVDANKKHQEEVKALLELEFNKIQGEYETQEIWTAVLTIVFLIFSFYSMFKSEELERQGHDALKSIRDVEQRAKNAYDKIEQEKSKKINSIQSQYSEWKKQRNIELTEELRKEKDNLTAHVSLEQKKAERDLSLKYKELSSNFIKNLEISHSQKLEEIAEGYKQEIDGFLKDLKEKNLAEIQNQVKQWETKFSEMKENFERQYANILDEFNTAQQNNPDSILEENQHQLHTEEMLDLPNEVSDTDDTIDDEVMSQ